jgi:hypothetical protein
MHAVAEVAAGQAVAAAVEGAEPGAAGDQHVGRLAVGVEEPLDQRAPARVLVDLVEDEQRPVLGQQVQTQLLGVPR